MKTVHLLHLNQWPILRQLQLEEALLRADDRNWCILNHQASDAIVMGISGKPELLIDETCWSQRPIPIIRRFSGGGTVVVDPNTIFITFICQADEMQVSCCPRKIMGWTEQFYRPLFKDAPFSLQENDYVLGARKVGGNAQYLSKNRWLHHSSFLWDYEPEKMAYLLMPPKAPAYRAGRQHADFLCRLKEHWIDLPSFIQQFKASLHQQFQVVSDPIQSFEEMLQRPHRRSTVEVRLSKTRI